MQIAIQKLGEALEKLQLARKSKSIFLEAIEKPIAERAAFIQSACLGNQRLETNVVELIHFFEKDGDSVLDTKEIREAVRRDAHVNSGAALTDVFTHQCPKDQSVLGRYVLVSIVRQDATGTVFRAIQTHPVRRAVFVKFLVESSWSAVDRIRAARCTAVTLTHPNIAPILDVGVHPQRGGFLVMQSVGGDTITGYCEEKQLSLTDRLNLLLKVCRAIEFMHQRDCIFGSLCPNNIRIVEAIEPEPKIIEFGVAISLQGDKKELVHASESREEYDFPIYKSPEQLQMPDSQVGSTTDVFSLGVMLYELVCGHPYLTEKQLSSLGYAEKIRFICDIEPRPISTQISQQRVERFANFVGCGPGRFRKKVQQSLDHVVQKCLRKAPEERHQSIAELVAELQLFIDELAISQSNGWFDSIRLLLRRIINRRVR